MPFQPSLDLFSREDLEDLLQLIGEKQIKSLMFADGSISSENKWNTAMHILNRLPPSVTSIIFGVCPYPHADFHELTRILASNENIIELEVRVRLINKPFALPI